MNDYLSSITALGSHLVDLGLSDVSALLSFLKLMLNLPEPGHVSVGLLLLLRDLGYIGFVKRHSVMVLFIENGMIRHMYKYS